MRQTLCLIVFFSLLGIPAVEGAPRSDVSDPRHRAATPPPWPGDADGDGDVDLDDYRFWVECMKGPLVTSSGPACTSFDFDIDSDVDISDFSVLTIVFRVPICGNGIKESGEACDDGNQDIGDGCRPDCTEEVCGDGIVDPGEPCDDGNQDLGDGCRPDCTVEECGDGIVDPDEPCDDGNQDLGDGCRPDCTVEVCGDGIVDPDEPCDDGNQDIGDGCRPDCTQEVCGDGIVDPGEPCDDGNSINGDGCRTDCTVEVCGDLIVDDPLEDCDPPDGTFCDATCHFVTIGSTSADDCSDATSASGQGYVMFNNFLANMMPDGPAHTGCTFFTEDQINYDVWTCWTSPCTGTIFADTCGTTTVDTKLAVYEGCACPGTDARLLDCNDDDCDVQSQLVFEAVAGQSYLVRIGTFPGRTPGDGYVRFACGLESCPGTGDCFTAHGGTGCADESCCEAVCAADPICCEFEWDDICVEEAHGFCGSGFAVCNESAGSCTTESSTPGCDDIACCNAICQLDTGCCIDGWDERCVLLEASTCYSSCQAGAGSCFEAGNTAGCEQPSCCAEVCARDPVCCLDIWGARCANLALNLCQ